MRTVVPALALVVLLLPGCSDSSETLAPPTGTLGCSNQSINAFVDCGDGTVTDNATKLTWLKAADCVETKTFAEAVAWAQDLEEGDCGLMDQSSPGEWRLPTKDEWETLVGRAGATCRPAIQDTVGTGCWSEGDPFNGVRPSAYWSSTDGGSASYAWIAYLNDGYFIPDAKTDLHYVWPVRGPF